MTELEGDTIADCTECGLPMMPIAEERGRLTLECANGHRVFVPAPVEPTARERMRNWIARRGAQLHVQHERWEQEPGAEKSE